MSNRKMDNKWEGRVLWSEFIISKSRRSFCACRKHYLYLDPCVAGGHFRCIKGPRDLDKSSQECETQPRLSTSPIHYE